MYFHVRLTISVHTYTKINIQTHRHIEFGIYSCTIGGCIAVISFFFFSATLTLSNSSLHLFFPLTPHVHPLYVTSLVLFSSFYFILFLSYEAIYRRVLSHPSRVLAYSNVSPLCPCVPLSLSPNPLSLSTRAMFGRYGELFAPAEHEFQP